MICTVFTLYIVTYLVTFETRCPLLEPKTGTWYPATLHHFGAGFRLYKEQVQRLHRFDGNLTVWHPDIEHQQAFISQALEQQFICLLPSAAVHHYHLRATVVVFRTLVNAMEHNVSVI